MKASIASYRENLIRTASREQILLLLYDGAIGFLRQAEEKIRAKEYEAKGRLLTRAYAIIFELNACLDHKAAPEIAEQLSALYLFIMKEIQSANARCDAKPIEGVLGVLETLREAWQGAADQVRAGERAPQDAEAGGERRSLGRVAA